MPGAYFQTVLKHPVGFGEDLNLSWLAASLATIAGALGSSLEDEDTVRNAAATRQRTPRMAKIRVKLGTEKEMPNALEERRARGATRYGPPRPPQP